MLEAADKYEKLFIKRKREVTGRNFCQTTVLGWLMEPECTSEGLAQIGADFGLEITAQGLDQRFTEDAAKFLKRVLEETISKRIMSDEPTIAVLERFDNVYIEDSSIVSLPEELVTEWHGCGNGTEGKGNSAIKLQVRWELKRGNLDGPHLFDGRLNDNKAVGAHREKEGNCLTIDDRGYWSLERFSKEAANNQVWLSYMKQTTHIVVDNVNYKIDEYLQNCTLDNLDIPILLGKQRQIPCRLLAKRLPPETAQKRRRETKRIARDKGQTASSATLTLCDWIVMVTNVPVELLSLTEALTLIRIRWQIELLFKLWKSFGQIDEFRSENPWRVLCQLYAKLIGMVILHWLLLACVWQFPDRSLFKAAQVIRRHLFTIALALPSFDALHSALSHLRTSLARGCRIKRSRKHPRAFQLLLALEAHPA